jgi:predicted TIM-barrel fold metal-dependent hydrolase
MRTITLEEHFASPSFLNGPGAHLRSPGSGALASNIGELLCDVGEGRVALMNAAGIDFQVLSITAPGVEQLEEAEAIVVARQANDYLTAAIREHPDRFAGFATLPTPAPMVAADELERLVREEGFKGAVINGHSRGRYLDDPFFWPILERAEALGVPIYLHPTQPPKPVVDALYAGFAPQVSYMFANAGWGWHIETAIHVLRLVLGGAFDRFPKLQIVVGHLGEGLPFMMQRVDNMSMALTKLQRPVSAYLRENVHYTFSGFNFTAPFLDLLMEVGVDRIMFSTDHPYASMDKARAFLDRLPVSTADRERIAHGNAERLLSL